MPSAVQTHSPQGPRDDPPAAGTAASGEPNDAGAGGAGRQRLAPLLALTSAGLFVALLAYGLLTGAPSTSIDESLATGEAPTAPRFELAVLDPGTLPARFGRVERAMADGSLALEELRGTPAVVNLWASWCVPCREEAPRLQRGWERLGPTGALFLGLNMQDLTGDALGFVDDFGLTFPQIRDPSNEVARDYGATGIPETYFVSARGRVVGHVIGVLSQRQLGAGVAAAGRGAVTGTRSGGDIRPQR